ncbi:sensor histidine kinase [Peribacillus asahii]|uniref:histidine kinase n=1 Tax=Peribacillus asahii TaxID=228899 RepID=A0A3Q9RNC0_9BACI|nr:HAMP domain-containing sensor histidine kinase [Peribacillus asahii]AZV43089.1 integral membrane sensor signal transduction histidine kinase [Peribacillus asahii]USK83202.1 HAMP domain-containing histidine kinase [Peribacillus asahii]
MKIKGVMKVASEIESKYGQSDFESAIDRLTFKNSVLVFITDTEGNIKYVSDEHDSGKPPKDLPEEAIEQPKRNRPLPENFNEFLQKLNASTEDYISYKVEEFKGPTLVYGSKLDNDTLLYISTSIGPINLTTNILKTQLVYVTITALLLGLVVSFFIAKKVAKPIIKITNSAERLAKGDYHVQFENGHYAELDQLAATLNYTTNELSKVEKLRRELIANISHDLRTPLTMIKAYAEMIRDISGEKKEKREAHLQVIIEESNRLASLVNNILELSILQSNNEALQINNVNLSETLKKILLRFGALSKFEGFEIKANIDYDLYVLVDEQRMERVIYNLMGNAINYIGEDKEIKVNLIDLGSRVRFEVIDTGKGIPSEELNLIWDRYYKAKTHKRSIISNGLGLSIVKSILEMHQAEFGIESAVGKGSKFWFELRK